MARKELLSNIKTNHQELYNYLIQDSKINSIFNNIENADSGDIYYLNRKIGKGIGYLGLDYFLTTELRFS